MAANPAVARLCAELISTETIYPGTDLRQFSNRYYLKLTTNPAEVRCSDTEAAKGVGEGGGGVGG
jgi:hypothetical protein